MKRRISIMLCMALVLAMTGCGNNRSADKPGSNQPTGVNDVLEQGMAEADNNKADNISEPAEDITQNQKISESQEAQSTESQETKSPEPSSVPNADSIPADSAEEIDVDLTALSGTMVYSEVNNMLVSPEQYIGKTVKMDGRFTYYHDEPTGNYYFACIIQDATACCAQGIEFVLKDDYTFPDDYPEADSEICVVGVYDTYEEKGYTYCTLREASLL